MSKAELRTRDEAMGQLEATLRAMKTDNNLLILKTDMDTGHGGKSGRFEAMRAVRNSWLI